MERQQPPQTTTTTLQQAAELLERSQQLLRAAREEEATNTTTATRVRQMKVAQLQRDPVLWAAYTRGWEDRTAVFRRATSGDPTTALRQHRSRSPTRPARQAAITRPTARPAPQPRAAERPPPRPLMERQIPAPRTKPTPPLEAAINPSPTPQAPTPTQLNARQRRNQQRLRDHRTKMQSQQHRLDKPAPTQTPETITPKSAPVQQQQGPACPHPTAATVPEVAIPAGTTGAADRQATAPSPTGDIEISPEEEARLLEETGTEPPDDVDMEADYYSPPTTPRQD